MFSLKCILLVAACVILTASASPIELENFYEPQQFLTEEYEYQPILVREARSPQGSFGFGYREDQNGRQGSVDYKQNVYNGDGKSVDAYAHGTRNFDQNQNSYDTGVKFSWD
ncbi:uncharacterized protein ACRADG_006335 [Cochliomyia hominivorax]